MFYFSISIIFVSSFNIFAGLNLVHHMGEMYLLAKKQIASAVYQRIKYFTYIQLYVKFKHNHIFLQTRSKRKCTPLPRLAQ